VPTEAVESLATNPERLKEPHQQCKLDRVQLDDALCKRVAEAPRNQFYGDGNVPHTPSKESPKFQVLIDYNRSVILAMQGDGLGFRLEPCKSMLASQLGRTMNATVRDGNVSLEFG
jgi:hypothetical protein